MNKKMFKKILASLLAITVLSTSSIGAFANVGSVLVNATSEPDTASTTTIDSASSTDSSIPTDAVSQDVATSIDSSTTISNTEQISTTPSEPVTATTASNSVATADTTSTTSNATIESAPQSNSSLVAAPVADCSSDEIAPVFIEPTLTVYVAQGSLLEENYLPDAIPEEEIPGAATDNCPGDITYTFNYDDTYVDDGSALPGTYTVTVTATDVAGNSTSMEMDQILTVIVPPLPTLFVSQVDYSTKVNIEVEYDTSIYPSDSTVYLAVYDPSTEFYDEIILDPGVTSTIYDQGNYNSYIYDVYVFSESIDALLGFNEANSEMIQLPKINSFSTTTDSMNKTITINYDFDLNSFTGAVAYITVNGERIATLDPNKHSITYTATSYGTYDIQLVLDYSESADPLMASTTVVLTPPPNLAYTGLETSAFEDFILFLQEFFQNLFK